MNAIWAIASSTVGEAVRRKVLLVILLIAMLLLSIIPALSILSVRTEVNATISTIFFVIRFTSALIAIILTIYMIPNEIERRTIYTILSKPVQRWQFLLGKYLGAVLSLAMMMAIMTVLALVMFYFNHRDLGKLLDIARQPMLYLVEMALLTAIAIFFSTFVAPLVNFFLSTGLWLVGTVLNPLYDSFASNPNTQWIMKYSAMFILKVLPNFANYDVKNPILHPGVVIQNETSYYLQTIGYGFLYIAVLLILGIVIFDRREV
jgi:ABC-type transport system involved in multi-copper enzyme maturation permease subunit